MADRFEEMARKLKEGDDETREALERMGEQEREAVNVAFQRLYGEPFTL